MSLYVYSCTQAQTYSRMRSLQLLLWILSWSVLPLLCLTNVLCGQLWIQINDDFIAVRLMSCPSGQTASANIKTNVNLIILLRLIFCLPENEIFLITSANSIILRLVIETMAFINQMMIKWDALNRVICCVSQCSIYQILTALRKFLVIYNCVC